MTLIDPYRENAVYDGSTVGFRYLPCQVGFEPPPPGQVTLDCSDRVTAKSCLYII